MSSQIGNILKVSLFGESHGTAIGAVIDGFPPGVGIDMEKLLAFMARRAPGRDRTATPRRRATCPGFFPAFWTVLPAERLSQR